MFPFVKFENGKTGNISAASSKNIRDNILAVCNLQDQGYDVHFIGSQGKHFAYLEKPGKFHQKLQRRGGRYFAEVEYDKGIQKDHENLLCPIAEDDSSYWPELDDFNDEELASENRKDEGPYEQEVQEEPAPALPGSAAPGTAYENLHPLEGEQEVLGDDAMLDELLPPGAWPLAVPVEPTAEERILHELTHTNSVPAPWCEICIQAKGKEDAHRRKSLEENRVTFDFQFFGRDGEAVDGHARCATVLTAYDAGTRALMCTYVPRKATDEYVLKVTELWIKKLGYDKVVARCDKENAIRPILQRLQDRMGPARFQCKEVPRYSHQSAGQGETANQIAGGAIRALLLQLKKNYKGAPELRINVNHILFPWMVKYAGWVHTRFHVNTTGTTARFVIEGRSYTKGLCQFGECVLARVPPELM